MSSNKQGAEGALSGETHISSALSRLAKLRFLEFKRTKGAATDLTTLGRTEQLGNDAVKESPPEVGAGRKVLKVGCRFSCSVVATELLKNK